MAKEIKKNKDKSYMPGYDVDDQVPRTNYSGSSRSFLNNFPKTPKTEPKRKDAASSRQPVSKSVFYADCTSGPLSASGPSSFLEATTESSPLTGSEPGLTHSLKTSSPLPIANAKSSMAGSTNKQESSSFNDDTKTSLTNYAKYSDRKIINTNSLPRDRSRTAGIKLDHSNIVSINSTSQPQLSSNHSWIASGMAQHHINGFTSKDLAVGCKLEIGDRVGVMINNKEFKGEVRWLGLLPDAGNSDAEVAGLEMDNPCKYFEDGCFEGKRHFECRPNTGLFLLAKVCRPLYQDFGGTKCPVVFGKVTPTEYDDISSICGQNKGIQGHYNSCYLDATLFSMFAFTTVFDHLIYRKRRDYDIKEYEKVQEVLRDKIVNPLRKNMYVRADRIMELRELLDVLGSVSGLTCEEKDPEEFLNSLLQQILKAEPFLKLSSGQESNYYQLFVEKNEKIQLPTVQHLLEQSLHSSNVKLREVPSCLIILMPRFGKTFKVYPRIFPSFVLEVTDIIENFPHKCSICGQTYAVLECFDCFHESTDPQDRLCGFCDACSRKIHSHENRRHHKPATLKLPNEFKDVEKYTPLLQEYMDLFAVVCIETSHYVSFVKCGTGPQAPWCFFDSMADRKGEQDGYNIPKITACQDLQQWLTDEGYEDLKKYHTDGGLHQSKPPNYVNRLLNDVYLCMYRSRDASMYK